MASLNYTEHAQHFKIHLITKLHIHIMSENPYTYELIKYLPSVFFSKTEIKDTTQIIYLPYFVCDFLKC